MRLIRIRLVTALVLGVAGAAALARAPAALADDGPHRFAWSNYDVVTGQNETFEIGAKGGCAMYHRIPGWSDWVSLGGCLRPGYGFDVGRNADNRYELFAIGYDDSVWHNWQTRPGRGPWSGWHSLGGKVPNGLGSASDPGGPRVSSAGGRISVYVPGTDNRLWVRQQTCANGCWGRWHHA